MGTGSARPAGDASGVLDQPSAVSTGEHSLLKSPAQEAPLAAYVAPYPPGWVDRLADWARRLPVPAWAFYVALGLAMYSVLLISAWTGGALPPGTFVLDYFLSSMTVSYFLVLIHYLDDSAAVALTRFRPVMTIDDDGYNKLSYQLTTLPAGPTWIATALGAAYSLGTLVVSIITEPSADVGDIAPFVPIVEIIFRSLIYAVIGLVIYHTIHQLLIVSRIYTNHTRINLFELGPMYALSGLAARTAVGIGIPTYIWFQFNSSSTTGISPADIAETVFLGMIIVATFIWPLWGAHNLLEREKQRLQDEAARRVETTIAALHSRIDAGELQDIGPLKETLDGLVTEQGVIDKLRTWPWRTETVRGLGLAFLLPIIIWIVQRVLERFGL